jgi:hypothetical protein
MTETLLRLIALNGYAAYRNAMAVPRTTIGDAFHRAIHPQPGDLVLEKTTVFRWAGEDTSPGPALGYLLRVVQEPIVTQEALDEMHRQGDYYNALDEKLDDIPKEKVFYIKPLDGSVPEYRWHNADFIRLETSIA